MRPDIGIWFGVTFDEYLGKYKVDITGELFDIDRYWLRAKVSETKQVNTNTKIAASCLQYNICSVCQSASKI